MQTKASQKQANGKEEWNVFLPWVCFALDVGKENSHMLRFALYCFALPSLREGSCHMSQCALLYLWEREAVTRYGLLFFVCFSFGLLVRGESCHML